jgi:hypothetical protein
VRQRSLPIFKIILKRSAQDDRLDRECSRPGLGAAVDAGGCLVYKQIQSLT